MVFLGGAVLANIVSQQILVVLHIANKDPVDGRQAQHVDLERRMGGARSSRTRQARLKRMIAAKSDLSDQRATQHQSQKPKGSTMMTLIDN